MKITKTQLVPIGSIFQNQSNPRIIRDNEFKQLVKSIKDFPKMLEARPIVVDENNIILGGNMRYKALLELGHTDVHIIQITEATEEQKKEFIIKDNVSKGEWDWDMIANEWDSAQLQEWGMNVWQPTPELDYGLLGDGDVDAEVEGMKDSLKKAIQIEFELEHYEEAFELIKFWREQGLYIGGFLIEKLKEEKNKL